MFNHVALLSWVGIPTSRNCYKGRVTLAGFAPGTKPGACPGARVEPSEPLAEQNQRAARPIRDRSHAPERGWGGGGNPTPREIGPHGRSGLTTLRRVLPRHRAPWHYCAGEP